MVYSFAMASTFKGRRNTFFEKFWPEEGSYESLKNFSSPIKIVLYLEYDRFSYHFLVKLLLKYWRLESLSYLKYVYFVHY